MIRGLLHPAFFAYGNSAQGAQLVVAVVDAVLTSAKYDIVLSY
jgi:hypothetical protein